MNLIVIMLLEDLERAAGIEPASSAWKDATQLNKKPYQTNQ